jgi:hypothetical protein
MTEEDRSLDEKEAHARTFMLIIYKETSNTNISTYSPTSESPWLVRRLVHPLGHGTRATQVAQKWRMDDETDEQPSGCPGQEVMQHHHHQQQPTTTSTGHDPHENLDLGRLQIMHSLTS